MNNDCHNKIYCKLTITLHSSYSYLSLSVLWHKLYFKKLSSVNSVVVAYVHNWSLASFCENCDQASHTTYVECVNFIHKWRDLQTPNDRFLGNFSYFCQKSAKSNSPSKYFFVFHFIWKYLAWCVFESWPDV